MEDPILAMSLPIQTIPLNSQAEAEMKVERALILDRIKAGFLEIVYSREDDNGYIYCTLRGTNAEAGEEQKTGP